MASNDQEKNQNQADKPVEKPREIPVVPIIDREQLNEGVDRTSKPEIPNFNIRKEDE